MGPEAQQSLFDAEGGAGAEAGDAETGGVGAAGSGAAGSGAAGSGVADAGGGSGDAGFEALPTPGGLPLTDEQRTAVARRSGPLLLAAGAGSGKTSVLVERFVSAVLIDGVRPERVLAITFTERAAWELKERLRKRLRELRRRDLARDVEGASVGTFHGFCARLLRADPLAAGLSPGFSILDERLADRLRLAAYGDALRLTLAGEDAQAIDVLAAYGADRLRKIVLGVHAELRSKGQRHPSIPAVEGGEAEQTCAVIAGLLESFGEAYERRKRARGAADFDDLELCALETLRGDVAVRQQWSERFDLLMVDEFQDTNPRQLALLAAIERDNLFTVGDEWQSIYGFRHADVGIFQRRRDELSRRDASLALTLNFRSDPSIVAAVNRAFVERFGDRHAPLRPHDGTAGAHDGTAGAHDGTTGAHDGTTGAHDGVEILLTDRDGWDDEAGLAEEIAAGLPSGSLWRVAEARMLARRIFELTAEGGAAPGDVAVLLRSITDLPLYERAIAATGLSTNAVAGGFWADSQVGDLLSWLRAVANPRDELALHGTLAGPLVGLSVDALGLLASAGRRDGGGLWEAVRRSADPAVDPATGSQASVAGLADADRARIQAFATRFQAARSRAPERGIATLLRQEIASARYAERLLTLRDGEQRLANVRKLIRLAAAFERSEGRDLRGFLDHVAHLEEGRGAAEPDAPTGDGERNAVRLMTIHAAKGLEFPIVCVADLGRAPNRSDVPDLLVDGERLGLRLLRLGDPSSAPALQYEQLRAEREAAEAEEEDRVLYVAMTRAQRRLLLSGAASFRRWPRDAPGRPPIAWLAPALLDGFEAVLAGAPPKASGEQVRCRLNTPAIAREVLALDAAAGDGAAEEHRAAAGDDDTAGNGGAAAGDDDTAGNGGAAAGEIVRVDCESSQPAEPQAAPALLGPDDALSYTTLVALERCGYRYYLERVLGMPEATPAPRIEGRRRSPALDARSRGEIVHRVLEGSDLEALADSSPDRVLRAAGELRLTVGRGEAQELSKLVAGLAASPLARRIGEAQAVSREHPFSFAMHHAGGDRPRPIVGTFDLLATESSGEWLVVDYKSDELADGEDLETLVADRYDAQRLIYTLAALRAGVEQVEIAHWFLQRPGEPVLQRCEASRLPELERALSERIERALRRGPVVSAHPHRRLCLTCPGRAGLCSWDDLETSRERRGS